MLPGDSLTIDRQSNVSKPIWRIKTNSLLDAGKLELPTWKTSRTSDSKLSDDQAILIHSNRLLLVFAEHYSLYNVQ